MKKDLLGSVAEVLELASQAEAAVGNFYRACAARWENEGEFWLGLAAEEDGHYGLLKRMISLVGAHPERYVMRGRFDPEVYRSFVDWVRANTEEVSGGMADSAQAVRAAKTIENTILENQLQKIAETTDAEYLGLVSQLVDQTRRHAALVGDKFNGIGK